MTTKQRIPIFLLAAALLLLPLASPVTSAVEISVDADGPSSVAMGADAAVAAGETHESDIVVLFGSARIDGTVTGDVVVLFGHLEISGTVEGDVVSFLSSAKIAETARLEGDLVNIGWSMKRASGSAVRGETVNFDFMSFVPFAGDGGGLSGLLRFILLVKLILLAFFFFILVLLIALIPRRIAVIAAAFPARWGWSLLTGILSYVVVVIGAVILCATVIGIPLALALVAALLLVKWIGLAALLYLLGQTIARNLFHRELTHFSCVAGGFVAYALISLIPLFGWIVCGLLNVLGVGIVILTRFGADPAVPNNLAVAGDPAPGAPPASPGPPVVPPPPSPIV